MAWLIISIFSVVIIALLLLKRAASASLESLRQHLQAGALVIDVRSAAEYHSGHLPGALNFPLNELTHELPRKVPDRQTVLLLHCLSGTRSRNGQRQLQRLGYKHVFNVGSLIRARQLVN